MMWITKFIDLLAKLLKWSPEPIPTGPMKEEPTPQPVENTPAAVTASQRLYNRAKNCLGTHQTLNPSVSPEVGCAEAVSAVLSLAGYPIPASGIAGTASLLKWLSNNSSFERIYAPELGAVIVSPTGAGNGRIPGHTGIFGGEGVAFPGDWGIMSNDSQTGLFLELWSLSKWGKYYSDYGGLSMYMFRPL